VKPPTSETALGACLVIGALLFGNGCVSYHRGALPGEPSGATFAQIEGARIRYTDSAAGKGEAEAKKPPVVLVHGFAASLDTWAAVSPVLQKTHRVVALDLKGFGWSDRPEGDYSPTAEGRIVLGLMTQLGIKRASIVAHSWGTSVALAATLSEPDRVERLALFSAWVYEEQQPTFFQWSRADGIGEALFGLYYNQRADDRIGLAFFDQKYVTEKLVDSATEMLDRPGTKAAALAAVRGQDYTTMQEKYRTVAQHTFIGYGREDGVTLPQYGERLHREIKDSRFVTYARCGHFPMIEAYAESTRDLVAFLDETLPGDRAQEGAAAVSPKSEPSKKEPEAQPKEGL
jgi:2-hydroxymuconate-semialdehyde hydrolase